MQTLFDNKVSLLSNPIVDPSYAATVIEIYKSRLSAKKVDIAAIPQHPPSVQSMKALEDACVILSGLQVKSSRSAGSYRFLFNAEHYLGERQKAEFNAMFREPKPEPISRFTMNPLLSLTPVDDGDDGEEDDDDEEGVEDYDEDDEDEEDGLNA